MHRGFWDQLPQPFFVLAPMYDVTDVAFRLVIARCGRPDVFFTEFVSADGLASPVGRERLMHHLLKESSESPIVAQLFGANPDNMAKAASLVATLDFSGIDINMGCPDKNIIKNGSCAALFKTPRLAQELIAAAKSGVKDALPVSVKIRIGDTKVDWQDWIAALLAAKPAAISVHLRTRKEMSKVPAHWEEMTRIITFIHDCMNVEDRPLIIGNGDIMTLTEAREKRMQTGFDGAMIGRGIFHNPWLFHPKESAREHSQKEKFDLLLHHAQLYEKYFTGLKSPDPLKRFYKIYINGFDHAAEIRQHLYAAANADEIKQLLDI